MMKKPIDKPHLNARYTQISAYVIATCLILYLLIRLLDHTGDILSAIATALHFLKVILVPIIGGFAIAYLLRPVVRLLNRPLQRIALLQRRPHASYVLAVLVAYLLVLLALALLLFLLVSSINHQLSVVRFEDITGFIAAAGESIRSLQSFIDRWLSSLNLSSGELHNALQNIGDAVGGLATSLGNAILASLSGLTGFLSNLFFCIIFSIYFLIGGSGLAAYWDRVIRTLSSERFYRGFHQLLRDADKIFSGYIKGQLSDALFMMAAVSIALSLTGVQFAVLIGILTGIGNLIPYVGPFVAYACTALSCLIAGDLRTLLVSAIVLLVLQLADANIVGPRLLSSNVEVHPLLVISCLLIGGAAGGFLGMLIGVPIGALIKLQFDRLIAGIEQRRSGNAKADAKGDAPD